MSIEGAGQADVRAYFDGNDYYEAAEIIQPLTINKALLTASPAPKSKVYGAELPEFTPLYSGFVHEEDASVIDTPPTGNTDASAESAVGEYEISLSGAEDNNYTFEYEPGTLTVNKATITVTAEDKVTR